MIQIPNQKQNTSHYYSYCLLNSFLLEDIDVEIGSMWIHLTLFDQKLLKIGIEHRWFSWQGRDHNL